MICTSLNGSSTGRFHFADNFEQLAKENIIDETDVDFISKTIIYILHGILTLHFSTNELSSEQLCADLDPVTDKLLKNRFLAKSAQIKGRRNAKAIKEITIHSFSRPSRRDA